LSARRWRTIAASDTMRNALGPRHTCRRKLSAGAHRVLGRVGAGAGAESCSQPRLIGGAAP
jgi:hypothetical protein